MRRVLVLCPSTHERAGAIGEITDSQLGQVRIAPDISFDIRPVKMAPVHWDSEHDLMLADIGAIEAGLTAQEEGYDAVVIETVSDSGLDVLRSVLDIPVIGPGRFAYMLALTLGDRFAVITMTLEQRLLYTRKLRQYGVADRCVSVRGIMDGDEIDYSGVFDGEEKQARYFPRLVEQATRAIEDDGAEVIIMGSTNMFKAAPYMAEHLPVPVINPASLMYKATELILDLGLTHSRRAYDQARTPQPQLWTAMVEGGAPVRAR
jgi:allantoin racemase